MEYNTMRDEAKATAKAVEFDDISYGKFLAYENVRRSGETNMFDIRKVVELSSLERSMIMAIMQNYDKLCMKYPEAATR